MPNKEKIKRIQEKLNELTEELFSVQEEEESVKVKCGDIVIGGRETQTKRMVCSDADGDLYLVTMEGKHKGNRTSEERYSSPDEDGNVYLKDLLNNYSKDKWSVVA